MIHFVLTRLEFKNWLSALGLAAALSAACGTQAAAQPRAWSFSGSDTANDRAAYSASDANQLSVANVRGLALKWKFTPHGSITATPTVEQGGLYVPDISGYLYKIDPVTGTAVWAHKLSEYTGNAASYAMSSPAISATSIVFGDRARATLIAVNKATGALLWSKVLDSHQYGAITGGPTIYNGVVYVGVASQEESRAINATYVPTFRGSVFAVDLATGAMKWHFRTVPAGYTGGAVWGGSLVVAPAQGMVFVGTGNNYSVPPLIAQCVTKAGTNKKAQIACLDPTDYVDSVVGLDLKTGLPRWGRRFEGADAWTVGCLLAGAPGCPVPKGRDADFASAPNLIPMPNFIGVPDDRTGTSAGWLLGAGEKKGMYWGINPANGGLFWNTQLGIGSILWGSAAGVLQNDNYIFSAMDNQIHSNTLLGQLGRSSMSWGAGFWSAMDAHTGKLIWQVPASPVDLVTPTLGATAKGPVSFTNLLAFAGDSGGTLWALDARTGFKLWSYSTGVTVLSGPAIFNNTVYWGVGGNSHGIPGTALYAFAVPAPH